MKNPDVIIIGAGPAGLFAASVCGAAGLRTCIFESNKSAGRKLLVTGQGKCNITNILDVSDFINCYGGKSRFVKKSIYAFSNKDLIDYFNQRGLHLSVREDGKVFPKSEDATEVRDHLLKSCAKAGVSIKFNCSIEKITHTGGIFSVFPGNEPMPEASTPALIIATGGFTLPSTGSNGSGYRLAEMLGHNIISPRPSLTGIISEPEEFSLFTSCAGIAIECELSLYRNNKKAGNYSGRVLFTHKGLSGPVIIDNSRDFHQNDELEINLIPKGSYELLSAEFISYCEKNGKKNIKHFFTAKDIPERIVSAVFIRSGSLATPLDKAACITSIDRKKLLATFTGLKFKIKSLEGRNKAMCTAGGVDTSEINSATMESKLLPGLYFTGEVLDVDGNSGGYNLQFAFSSARAAAMDILKQNNIDVDT